MRNVRPHVRVPLVGIGGITPENVGRVIEAGADRVAVATRRFLHAIREARRLTGPSRPL